MQKLTSILGVALFGALLIGPLAAQAGEAQAAPQEEQPVKQVEQKDPASLQKEAYSKFVALRASMEDLRKQLAERDESKAERIKRGLRLVQEAKLSERMGEVRDLLEEASWDEAISKMTEVQTRLNQLMLVLLDRDDDLSDILERIETLDAFKKRVDELLDQQRKERDASVEAERLAEQLDRIQQAKQRVNKLLDQQSKLRSDTQQQGAGDKPSEDLAKRQDQLEKDAKDLAGELREIEQAESDMDKGGAPSEGKPTEGKPGEGKPAEGKPGEGKPSEGEGSEGGKPSSQVGKASESMGKSGQKLEQNKPEDSLDDQEKAIEDLKAAQDNLKELEEEARRRLMELPFEKMEKDQLSTKQKTDKLAEDMEDAETGGENNIQQAVPKQKNAAGSLKEMKPGKAKQDQQDAVDQLEEAQRRLEDALAQLRQELQEEVLKALEERFTEMLARQRQITAQTILTEKKRKEIEKLMQDGRTPTWVRERCAKLADGERSLVDEAASALRLIEEEGSTAVFPEIVKDLADDLRLAGRMLERYETGPGTVEVQKSVEQMLEDLLDALTRRMEEQQGGT
jgi:myosin heavy subunit